MSKYINNPIHTVFGLAFAISTTGQALASQSIEEVVVGTLDAVYSNLEGNNSEEDETFDLNATFAEAVAITNDNLADAMQNMGDPLGLRTLDASSNVENAAAWPKFSS